MTLVRRRLHDGLEPSPRYRLSSHDPPGRNLRGAVPARVEHPAAYGERGAILRTADPREAERAVALATLRQARVEYDRTLAGELRHERRAAPADEDVPVREHLRVAHVMGQHMLGAVHVRANERRAHPRFVERQQQRPRLWLLRRRRRVVEDAHEPACVMPHVVLPLEARALAQCEVAALAAEAPQYPARPFLDLVRGPRVPRGDE